MENLVGLAGTLALLVIGYLAGSLAERSHYKSITRREALYRKIPVLTFAEHPQDWDVQASTLVGGNVVVSIDYFKSAVAVLRSLIGGRVRAYEPLLDRARREAVLRMIESARAQRYDAIVNVRLETSRLANSLGGREGTAGVEILAFGTALRLARDDNGLPFG